MFRKRGNLLIPAPKESKPIDEYTFVSKPLTEQYVYKFKGNFLTVPVAENAILQVESSSYRPLRDWVAFVKKYHESRGGFPAEVDVANIVSRALISLHDKGRVRIKLLKISGGRCQAGWRTVAGAV